MLEPVRIPGIRAVRYRATDVRSSAANIVAGSCSATDRSRRSRWRLSQTFSFGAVRIELVIRELAAAELDVARDGRRLAGDRPRGDRADLAGARRERARPCVVEIAALREENRRLRGSAPGAV